MRQYDPLENPVTAYEKKEVPMLDTAFCYEDGRGKTKAVTVECLSLLLRLDGYFYRMAPVDPSSNEFFREGQTMRRKKKGQA